MKQLDIDVRRPDCIMSSKKYHAIQMNLVGIFVSGFLVRKH